MEIVNPNWPIIVLLIGIITVIVLITVVRLHAFISLVLAGVLVGALSNQFLPGSGGNHFVRAVELTMTELGTTAGKIAWVIALAAILGVALTLSGAAEKIVIKFLDVMGEKYAAGALLISGFILSIPVFFDTVFFLLVPIAYSMGRRMKKNYVLYVLAVSIGGAITHTLVPPTPGPLIIAEELGLNLGIVIVVGLLAGILPAIVGYYFARYISRGSDISPPSFENEEKTLDESELPGFTAAILPIVIPLFLIILASAKNYIASPDSSLALIIDAVGNKNVAMLTGAIIAVWVLAKQKNWGMTALAKAMEKPLEIAGVIILITSAGGAFGGMIRHTGIGDWISSLAESGFEINYILLAWIISALMKIAQGSSTVAMITTAGIIVSLTTGGAIELPYHPVYLFLAIGFGSAFVSWMNDSGFWVICKLSGFTEKQTLKFWTTTYALIGLVGLFETLLFSKIIPLV